MTTPVVPAIDYSSRDYNGLRQSMLDYATTLVPEWTTRSESDFGMVLVELVAYMGDIMSYYIDRSASEAFLSTAALRSSVLAQAALMGYRPQAASPSIVTLQFTAAATAVVTVPTRTRVSTSGSTLQAPVYFEVLQDLVFTGAGTTAQVATVSAVQGETVFGEQIGVSNGTEGQFFLLAQSPVIESAIGVTVLDIPLGTPRTWSFVDNLVESTFDAEVFSIDTTDTGQTMILFGNGVTGKVPVRGAVLVAYYRVGGGAVGNVAAGTVTLMVDNINNILSVTNGSAATGGADEESLDSIRANAPAVFRAANRAVTAADHAALALRVSGVAMATALSAVYTNVTIYVAPVGGGIPTGLLLSNVTSFVQALAMVGVSVHAAAVSYLGIDVTASIVVFDQYDQESVRVAALTAVSGLLAFGNLDFSQNVTVGAVYQAIMSTPGVRSALLITLAASGGSGVADVAVDDWRIATAGALQMSASGGVIQGAATTDLFGTLPTMPTPTAAPTVVATTTGPATTQLVVTWSTAANNTLWYLEITFKDGGGLTRSVSTIGSYAVTNATATIGRDVGATSIQVRVESFNGTTGPAYSPTTTVANPS